MERKHTLIDNAAEKRYELDLGDGMALAEYVLGHGLIVLTHTEVPPKYEGRGIGKELVQGVLEDIRRKKLKVVPQCPFVATYIRRHPEWMDLVRTAENKYARAGSAPPQPPARRERPAAKPDSFRRVRFCLLPTGIFPRNKHFPLNKYRYSLFPKNFRLEIWFIL